MLVEFFRTGYPCLLLTFDRRRRRASDRPLSFWCGREHIAAAMKITQALCKQDIGRLIKWQWRAQRKKTLIEMNAERILASHNIPVVDSKQIMREPVLEVQKQDVQKLLKNIVGPAELPLNRDNTHPSWLDDPCFVYGDHSVLVHGLDQAKVLTNTVEPEPGLPQHLSELFEAYRLPDQDAHVRKAIEASFLFDAVQVKLPIRKDPKRPAWKFPRDYGIPNNRRNNLIVSRLLQLCESSVGSMSSSKVLSKDVFFRVPLQRARNLSLNVRADALLLSDTPLPPYTDVSEGDLPDIQPLDYTISLDECNIYVKNEFVSPIAGKFNNIHTAFVHFNETEVKNLYETPVLETQILGRSLLKSYAFAVANAKSKFGDDVKELPEPITLQCVQTNSQWFHFSVFQLNSLAGPEENGKRNIYWQTPLLDMYNTCVYDEGVPLLEGYNPEVFKHFLSFYMNGTNYEVK